MIRILIVDDEKIVRKGIAALLPWDRYNMKVVGEAENYSKAMDFLENNTVDLLFADITMPGKSGFDLIKEVRRKFPMVWTVILTCHQDFNYIQEALRLGAIDYIVKTQLELEPVDETLERISKRIKCNEKNIKISESSDIYPAFINSKYPEEINEGIINALNYIESNITKRISQDEAAKCANMSKGYFSRCFKDIVGKLFIEYVQEAKIKKAMEFLLQSNRTVYWIAGQLGFQDVKYFSKLFKEYAGLLPSEFRKQVRKDDCNIEE